MFHYHMSIRSCKPPSIIMWEVLSEFLISCRLILGWAFKQSAVTAKYEKQVRDWPMLYEIYV